MALAAETAARDCKQLQEHTNNEEKAPQEVDEKPINRVGKSTPKFSNKPRNAESKPQENECYRCRGKHHASNVSSRITNAIFAKRKGILLLLAERSRLKTSHENKQIEWTTKVPPTIVIASIRYIE